MASPSVAYTYRYPFPSALKPASNDNAHPELRLATCTGADEHPHFFAGAPRQAHLLGKLLLVLSDVVRTHFYQPFRPALLDPVVTASEGMLRFEGFSSCCGVYARADLPPAAFDAEITGRGTTNVDFNDPMRSALARMRDHDEIRLAVGRDEVVLEQDGGRAVEKKVKLPVRWLKGFGEVQAYQADLEPKLEVPAAEALRFVRGLPKSQGAGARRRGYVVQSGRALRVSPREGRGPTVPLAGGHRVRVLESLLPGARRLRIWSDDGTGVSAWEIEHETARFFLVLSPELHRGFSGEGQLLDLLASGIGRDLLATVRGRLAWQTRIDPDALADDLGVPADKVHGALAALGARGLAGYDAADGAFFHRELPFDAAAVEALQPRLKNARKLLDEDGARLLSRDAETVDVEVQGTGVRHQVRLALSPDGVHRCTCRWWSRYQGARGPCKHVLVARLLADEVGSIGHASEA